MNIIPLAALIAATTLPLATLASTSDNYFGVGSIHYADSAENVDTGATSNFTEAKYYVTGTLGDIPNLRINADFIDAEANYYRIDGQYMVDQLFSLHVGYSIYEQPGSAFPGTSSQEDKDLYFGAGMTFNSRIGETYLFGQRENLFGGYMSAGFRHRFTIYGRLNAELGYRVNSEIPDEARAALLISF